MWAEWGRGGEGSFRSGIIEPKKVREHALCGEERGDGKKNRGRGDEEQTEYGVMLIGSNSSSGNSR